MNVPEAGQTVTIHFVTQKPKRVSLLGYSGKLKFLADARRREHYEKPSVKRKKKAEAARKRKY